MARKVRDITRPIPVCQQKLRVIAAEFNGMGERPAWTYADFMNLKRRLLLIVRQLYRRKATRRAPPQQRKLTPRLAARLRTYLRAHPKVSYQTACHRLNLNTGRASEANAGIKT